MENAQKPVYTVCISAVLHRQWKDFMCWHFFFMFGARSLCWSSWYWSSLALKRLSISTASGSVGRETGKESVPWVWVIPHTCCSDVRHRSLIPLHSICRLPQSLMRHHRTCRVWKHRVQPSCPLAFPSFYVLTRMGLKKKSRKKLISFLNVPSPQPPKQVAQ